jgi:predicted phage terminase large subunit-like protein
VSYTPQELAQYQAAYYASSFARFVEHFWPYSGAGTDYIPAYHVDAIVEHLQAVADGQLRRLVILIAVRHSKSILTEVMFPAWTWTRRPETRILTASYVHNLAERDALRAKRLIESQPYQSLFPWVSLDPVKNRIDDYLTTAGGFRKCVSVSSGTSGADADLVVCDDLHDWHTRDSEAERHKSIDYFDGTLSRRLVRPEHDPIVLAGHRVHEDDVYAMLRERHGDDGTWTWLVLPEEARPIKWFNGLGWQDKRQDGELLWDHPEKFNSKVIAQEKKKDGYHAIFLQEPTNPEGDCYRKEWLQHEYTEQGSNYLLTNGQTGRTLVVAKDECLTFGVCDPAISEKKSADYSVCLVFDISPYGHLILRHLMRERLDGTKLVPKLEALYRTYRMDTIGVEDVQFQRMIIDNLQERGFSVKALKTDRLDKRARSVNARVAAEAGKLWFPAGAEFNSEIRHQLLGFPNTRHDDVFDVIAWAGVLANRYGGSEPEPVDQPVLTPEHQAAKVQQEQQDEAARFREWQRQALTAGLRFSPSK